MNFLPLTAPKMQNNVMTVTDFSSHLGPRYLFLVILHVIHNARLFIMLIDCKTVTHNAHTTHTQRTHNAHTTHTQRTHNAHTKGVWLDGTSLISEQEMEPPRQRKVSDAFRWRTVSHSQLWRSFTNTDSSLGPESEKRGTCFRACLVLELLLFIPAVFLLWGILSLPLVFFFVDVNPEVSK